MGEQEKPDERLAIPLDPEEALRALLKVDPESEPVERDEAETPSGQARKPSRSDTR